MIVEFSVHEFHNGVNTPLFKCGKLSEVDAELKQRSGSLKDGSIISVIEYKRKTLKRFKVERTVNTRIVKILDQPPVEA